ncbi:MAG: UDP-N-acetylmuramoyl-L-alanyl-D-glutamate--2,6-diaminopimelate ligase [Lactobacillaceae bacterium]|jgi:UDP-N-acetylmuramoyl-L-alanyl-D-glutamate--2,6-diaminopimelate ligase|nr:UDP-N-acetylmuramoyl-L-alanyl-D-glutamate--2,6-diaminopimelate ligase [Lactobacillaceae bacterium]
MFKTEDIINQLTFKNLLVESDVDQISFEDLQYNSNSVTRNDTLFVVKGNIKDQYILDAVKKGATAIVTTVRKEISIPQIIVKDEQKTLAALSALFFNNPQENLEIIGITGTKGKTSTSYILYSLLFNLLGKENVALFSTIETKIGADISYKSHLTTPESYDLFSNMAKAVDAGVKYLVMEVSSQAYLKNRVFGLTFDVGIFLNISEDHVGQNEHPTFEDYLEKKVELSKNSRVMLVNGDDFYKDQFLGNAQKDVVISSDEYQTLASNLSHSVFEFENHKYELLIPGDFNVLNAIFALKTIEILGLCFSQELIPIENIPGRMLKIQTQDHGIVFVDYAHNYDSLKHLMLFLKTRLEPKGKIIIVLGSTGNKGQNRREGFGKAISEFADVAILSSDDPGFEDPKMIADEIKANITNTKVKVDYIEDRKEAIKFAIDSASKEDLVVLAAKGEDLYQKINGVDTPYQGDYQIAEQYVKDGKL